MIAFPHCKINLGLHVTERLADGYHHIETCFYPIPWSDVLEIIPSKEFSFNVTGSIISGDANENLCVKAYQAIQKKFNISAVSIHLHKIIPMGAGLGGGSSDASFCLRMLNEIFSLKISTQELVSFASTLGSDCSFFIEDDPKLGSGKGDILNSVKIDLQGMYIVVVQPAVHISTVEAYGLITPSKPTRSIEQIINEVPVSSWHEAMSNDFEVPIFKKYPQIKNIKDVLYEAGATYASMSGSGSAVYGIFDSPVDLQRKFTGCTYWAGKL